MRMISDEALRAFQDIWQSEFGEAISDQYALEEATNLLTLFDALYRPVKAEWLNEDEHEHGQKAENQPASATL